MSVLRADRRWLIVFAGNLGFLLLVGQVNHYLSHAWIGFAQGQLYLFLLGAPVAFAALRLSLGHALAATIPTALAAEAGLPVAPGTLMLPAVACVCVALAFRAKFNRFESAMGIIVGLSFNLALMLVLCGAALGAGGLSWARVLSDLVASQLALAALTGWFFAAQTRLLGLCGFNVETELREPL